MIGVALRGQRKLDEAKSVSATGAARLEIYETIGYTRKVLAQLDEFQTESRR